MRVIAALVVCVVAAIVVPRSSAATITRVTVVNGYPTVQWTLEPGEGVTAILINNRPWASAQTAMIYAWTKDSRVTVWRSYSMYKGLPLPNGTWYAILETYFGLDGPHYAKYRFVVKGSASTAVVPTGGGTFAVDELTADKDIEAKVELTNGAHILNAVCIGERWRGVQTDKDGYTERFGYLDCDMNGSDGHAYRATFHAIRGSGSTGYTAVYNDGTLYHWDLSDFRVIY